MLSTASISVRLAGAWSAQVHSLPDMERSAAIQTPTAMNALALHPDARQLAAVGDTPGLCATPAPPRPAWPCLVPSVLCFWINHKREPLHVHLSVKWPVGAASPTLERPPAQYATPHCGMSMSERVGAWVRPHDAGSVGAAFTTANAFRHLIGAPHLRL